MKKKAFPLSHRNDGMVMLATVFLLLVLLPITVVFVRWVTLHRKGTTQARVHIKEYYAGISTANIARYRIQQGITSFPWGSPDRTDPIDIGDGTTVTVETKSITSP
jgi:hypothetical protein